MKQILISILKGLWIGGTLTVPGASGGSMAMILGIYDKLIESVDAFMHRGKDKKAALLYLLQVGLAGIIGFILFSRLVSALMARFPLEICFFFSGAIAGGIPIILKATGMKRPKFTDLLFVLIGAVFVYVFSLIPEGLFSFPADLSLGGIVTQLIGGVLVAIGFVLPGISLSHMLYIMGIYEELMNKVSQFDFLPLIPFAIGGVIGVFATTYAVKVALTRFPRASYLIIFGFLVGSIPQIFEGQSVAGHSIPFYLLCGLLALLGFGVIGAMSLPELLKKES